MKNDILGLSEYLKLNYMISTKLYFERNPHKTTRKATPMKGLRQQ